MTYLVFIDTQSGEKTHSIWNNCEDCKHQVDVLNSAGYLAWWEFIPAALNAPNGQYLV
jgi:hypothetical protein